ncbi:MAG TPA: NAD-dependent deacylase [Flavobacterium sp.]|nr:NAD-dependent deacylase [Flavobacterium sp.]
MKKKLAVLSGAGISAESGIKTFRDAGGLWEGHDIMEVASPEGWRKNPELVLDFYNKRKRQLKEAKPNRAHAAIAELEAVLDVYIITQNVDDLHEKAGSKNVLHLHGELLKARSTKNENYIIDWTEDLNLGHFDDKGNQLRPHIVWFGEAVPALGEAAEIIMEADYVIIAGTSMQVYPAAGLIDYAGPKAKLFYIDPKPATIYGLKNKIEVIAETASKGMEIVREKMLRSL